MYTQYCACNIHCSRYTREFLEEKGINWWRTPAESPDLNPIENMWRTCGSTSSLKYYLTHQYKPRDLAGLTITSGKQTMSGQNLLVCGQNWNLTVAMSGQARTRASMSTEGPPAKKRAVSQKTVEKWMVNYRALNTSVWLKFDTGRSRPRALSEM